jgi:hypothetical protein
MLLKRYLYMYVCMYTCIYVNCARTGLRLEKTLTYTMDACIVQACQWGSVVQIFDTTTMANDSAHFKLRLLRDLIIK